MTISQSLQNLYQNFAQCDSLIASAHRVDATSTNLFSPREREQITAAAFLNLFIAWEEFIEASITDFMMGDGTMGGVTPTRYVTPTTRQHSNKIVIQTQKYFDYADHNKVRKLAELYFYQGYPFETPLSSINAELSDLRIIRNACAHLSSTTNAALERLATRILGQSQPGIGVYRLLTTIDPRVQGNATTVYAAYRDKLIAAATLIAQG